MRGEYVFRSPGGRLPTGSPPLAWGIHLVKDGEGKITRITPTCVGNTRRSRFAAKVGRDHPHLRGEYLVAIQTKLLTKGSPPLAWGIPCVINNTSVDKGITPTCVGNTLIRLGQLTSVEDHPHLRGEYPMPRPLMLAQLGSPPLAWGIQKLKKWQIGMLRITPTCVGNTRERLANSFGTGDHPHLRGEYTDNKG